MARSVEKALGRLAMFRLQELFQSNYSSHQSKCKLLYVARNLPRDTLVIVTGADNEVMLEVPIPG